jgi:catechol 2,3-dioxygenase-like lactoylglutathione lyase family enzyme
MTRGIDHLVLAVRDLDQARGAYERLGFTLTPKAQHPFGTENALVQLDGCFLELLAIADAALFPEPEAGAFSFPRFNEAYLEKHEGMSMLVLDSTDAAADRKDFAAAGLQIYPPFEFGRDAKQPDGSTARVGFKLAFATDPYAPEAAFFTSEQLAPQFFWKPDYQRHDNSAKTVTEVVMISEAPTMHWKFFEGFVGTDEVQETETGLQIETARGCVRIERPDGVAETWGTSIALADYPSPRFAAFVIGVSELEETRRCLEAGGFGFFELGDRLIVSASESNGTAIAFEAGGT